MEREMLTIAETWVRAVMQMGAPNAHVKRYFCVVRVALLSRSVR
jgi:hypothetical protein